MPGAGTTRQLVAGVADIQQHTKRLNIYIELKCIYNYVCMNNATLFEMYKENMVKVNTNYCRITRSDGAVSFLLFL